MPARAEREARFHPTVKLVYGDRSFQAAREAGVITQDDETLIREYVDEKAANKHISEGRQLKIIYTLVNWRNYLKAPYRDLTYQNVISGIKELQSVEITHKDGEKHLIKKNTLHDYSRILKAFILWMIDNEYSSIEEKKIRKVSLLPRDYDTTAANDLLTIEELMKLIGACKQARDRALITTLYESGCRIGELHRSRWKDFIFDQYGIRMEIRDQKENQIRNTRLVKLAPAYLAQWRDVYQVETGREPEGMNYVFLTAQGNPIEYPTVKALLERLKERANLTKRITPHLFRKSRITHMIIQGYRESTVKEIMWKNQNSEQFKVYLRLSGMNIEDDILEMEGVSRKDKVAPKVPDKVVCPNCFKDNGPTNTYCYNCGTGLTERARRDYNETVKTLRKEKVEMTMEERLEASLKEIELIKSELSKNKA